MIEIYEIHGDQHKFYDLNIIKYTLKQPAEGFLYIRHKIVVSNAEILQAASSNSNEQDLLKLLIAIGKSKKEREDYESFVKVLLSFNNDEV